MKAVAARDALRVHRLARVTETAKRIATKHDLPVECVLQSEVRDPAVTLARHELWLELYGTGLSFSAIADLTAAHHTSVRSALLALGIRSPGKGRVRP